MKREDLVQKIADIDTSISRAKARRNKKKVVRLLLQKLELQKQLKNT